MEYLALVASLAESDQLLRLAEVEHILGTACLQLGFAAASQVMNQKTAQSLGSSPREPATEAFIGTALPGASRGAVASKATVAEAAAAAAGGRTTWGFGAGPFAEVFATKSGIFSGEGDGEGEHGDGGVGDVDDDAIIEQLEVDCFSSVGHQETLLFGFNCRKWSTSWLLCYTCLRGGRLFPSLFWVPSLFHVFPIEVIAKLRRRPRVSL